MKRADLIKALGRLKIETGSIVCLGCGHEHNCSTQGCALIQAAVEELSKMQWIPVKEAIPEDGQPCLVYTRQRERSALVYQWEDCDECEINTFDTFEVTHWMPLPEPPEVSEDG